MYLTADDGGRTVLRARLPTQLRPLVETYLGSLPASGKAPHWKDIGVKWARGPITKVVVAGSEPKSFVSLTSVGETKLFGSLPEIGRAHV